MAGKIRGITIELNADASGVMKEIGELNGEIRDTQKQLKDVEKLLKLDPNNTELLRQKQELLNKSIETSKQKVEQLEKAQQELGERTADNAEQYDAIEREIIACKAEQDKWNKSLSDMQPQAKSLKDTLSEVSAATGKAAEKTKALSAAADGLGAELLGNAVKSALAADDINTLAKQYGVSVREIQRMNYAQDMIDVSTKDMLSSYAKLTKQMGAGSEAFEKLGVNIYDVHGELRDSRDVWYDTLEALSKVSNETDRDVLAMDLFGKSAASLAGVIDDGGEALKTLGQEAEDAGLILSQDALDSANQFNDAMDRLKATASQSFLEAGASLATTLVPALEKLAGLLSSLLTWFGNLSGGTQAFILVILGLVAAISPVLSLISLITGAAAALSVGTMTLIGTIGGVIAVIAAVVAAGVLLYQNWDTIKEKASQLWQTIKTAFNNMLDSVTETMGNIKDAIVNGWNEAIDFITSLPSKAYNWGADIIKEMIKGITDNPIADAISGVATTIKNFIGFSEPDMGPLSNFHTFMPDMMQMMADGIADNTWRVENAINATAGAMAPQTTAADYSPITGRLDSLIGAAGTPVAVNVVLQGDAAGVFKLVRGQNSQYIKSTGRSGF
ncbi:MAG: hypothetical protein K6F23_03605 [Solobacterium sp.]|nr:hypothetical protein [Solobacterium sp.]